MASRPLPLALALAALLGIATLAVWLWPTPPAAPETPVAVAADATTPAAATETDALLQRARDLLARGALIAPAGANAVETYLAILQRDATHAAARAALFEMQPVVADGIRGALAAADWSEAERLIALLGRVDPDSVLREPLAAELARRRLQAAAEAAPAAPLQAPAALPPIPAVGTPPSDAGPSPSPPTIRTADTAATPASTPSPEAAAPAPAPAPAAPLPEPAAAPAPVVATLSAAEQPARLLNNPPLVYPPQAKRQRIEGWVEVEVQIAASGDVTQARVIRAEPPGVFDREALRTAQRWRFAPRELDGRPVASIARRRVNFSLGS